MTKERTYKYEQPCSRCDGSGIDPEMSDCICDCCENGKEILTLTEAEAKNHPNAERRKP